MGKYCFMYPADSEPYTLEIEYSKLVRHYRLLSGYLILLNILLSLGILSNNNFDHVSGVESLKLSLQLFILKLLEGV